MDLLEKVERLIEATSSFKVTSKSKKKVGSRLHHTVELTSKKKISVDDVAFTIGYHPMAYGISNVEITDLGDDKWKYEFQTSSSAG